MAGKTGMIIDADSHIEEPDEVWNFIDEPYRYRRPVAVKRPNLTGPFAQDMFWLIDGQAYPRPLGYGPSLYGTPVSSTFAKSKKFSIESQTLVPASARIADMDRLGIDLQVLFPTLFLDLMSPDVGLEAALMRSYNTWLAQTCAPHTKRLKWVAIIPVRSPPAAVEELRRVKALGAVAMLVLGTAGDSFLHEPAFDAVWAEAERLNMPIAMHVGWSMQSLHSKMNTIFCSTTFVAVPMMFGLFSMVGGGVLDRFPRLRVGFFEAGADWLPYMAPRMERYWQVYTAKQWPGTPRRNPVDWFSGGNIYFSCEGDERFLPQVAELLGEDHLMTSADLPHEEALEDSIREIRERGDISETLKRKILDDNPSRFFGF
ncbi:MAG: amidohydrolase [Alphaproteobacteria bacterium]|nr:amidohydrolase [Alphaproteobacteria bacterium]